MKEKLLEFFHAKNYWPRSFEEIIFELRLEDQRHEVKKALKELTASYEMAVNKKGKYILPEDAGIHVGAISIKNSNTVL